MASMNFSRVGSGPVRFNASVTTAAFNQPSNVMNLRDSAGPFRTKSATSGSST